MNTNTMLKSKWYLVEIFTAKKAFRITVKKPLVTKAEALQLENSRVKAHNYKSLSKLIEQGYIDLNSVNDADTPVKEENAVHGNCEAVKPIEKVEVKQVKIDLVKLFLVTPPRQKTQYAFDYSKQWERYERIGKPRAEKALAQQIAEYR